MGFLDSGVYRIQFHSLRLDEKQRQAVEIFILNLIFVSSSSPSSIHLHACHGICHGIPSCMVKLNLVHAKEYSKCLAKDFWMDSGSLGS